MLDIGKHKYMLSGFTREKQSLTGTCTGVHFDFKHCGKVIH